MKRQTARNPVKERSGKETLIFFSALALFAVILTGLLHLVLCAECGVARFFEEYCIFIILTLVVIETCAFIASRHVLKHGRRWSLK